MSITDRLKIFFVVSLELRPPHYHNQEEEKKPRNNLSEAKDYTFSITSRQGLLKKIHSAKKVNFNAYSKYRQRLEETNKQTMLMPFHLQTLIAYLTLSATLLFLCHCTTQL